MPPVNDNFASADDLMSATSGTASYDNTGATTEVGEPGPSEGSGTPHRTVWAKWLAPSDGACTVSLCDSLVDTVLGVFTGVSVGALTEVRSDDDSCPGSESILRFGAVSGTTYYWQIGGYSDVDVGVIGLEWSFEVVDCDFFDDACDLGDDASGTITGDNTGASTEVGEPAPSVSGPDLFSSLWYTWTAPSDGIATFTMRTWPDGGLILAVYSGGPNFAGLVEEGSTTDLDDPITATVAESDILYIQVSGWSDGIAFPDDVGAFTVDWDLCIIPANDDWANAEDLLSALNGSRVYDTTCATVEASEPGPTAGDGDPHKTIWYKWTAPSDRPRTVTVTMIGSRRIDTPSVAVDTMLGIYTGASLAGLSEVDSDADTVTFTTTPTTVYYWQAGGATDADFGMLRVHWETVPIDIDFATIPGAARQGGIDVVAITTYVDRLSIEVIDPDDDINAVIDTIDNAKERTFLDESQGQGSFGFRLQNRVADPAFPDTPGYVPMVANPSLALALRRRMFRVSIDGEPAFTGYGEARRRRLVSAQRDADQFTVVSGRRWEAWLDKAWVQPPNMSAAGQPSEPYNKSRRFNYIDPRYDDSDWVFPVELARQDGLTVGWTGLPPAWPDPIAYWLGRPGMVQNPAVGQFGAETSYFRAAIIDVPATDSYSVYAGADDTVQFFLDGAKLIDVAFGNVAQQGWASTGYYRLNKWQGTIGEGFHTLAVAVSNLAWPPINPTGFVATMIRDATGEVVFGSGDNGFWKCLPNPGFEPGMTPGFVMEVLQLEAQNRGILDGWTLGFDRYVDSNGRPWPELNDIVLTVGDPYTAALARLNEAYCDIRPSRMGGQLDAYVKGTAGSTVAVGFQDNPSNLANIVELEVNEANERGNVVMFVWRNGSFVIAQPGFAPGDENPLRIETYLELGEIDTLEAAMTLATEYAEIALAESQVVTIQVNPRGYDDTPYLGGVTPWDQVPIDSADLDITERVRSVELTQDDTTKQLQWRIELRDQQADRLDRFQTLLSRISAGGGGSTVNATAVTREDPLPFIAGAQFVSFGFSAGATDDEVGPQPMPMRGTVRELVLRRKSTDTTGDVTVQLYATGVLIGSCTMLSGNTLGKANIDPPVRLAAHIDDLLAVLSTGNNFPLVAMAVIELAS